MQPRIVRLAVLAAIVPLAACGRKHTPAGPPPQAEAPAPDAGGSFGGDGIREDDGLDGWSAPALSSAWSVLQQRVHFEFDQSDLGSEAQGIIAAKSDILRAHPTIRLRITGHADDRGSTEYNLALGMRRAMAIRESLEGYGLDGARFEVASMGEEEPLDAAQSERAYARNRRAEFAVLGGLPAPRR